MTHSEVIWFIQQAAFICELWKCWMTLCTYMCWVTEKTCMKVFCYSRKRVVASVCANSCSAGWWEALLVERGEHCERCNTCTSRYKRWCDGLEAPEDWLAEHHCWWLRVAVCVVATALVFLPTNMTRICLKKLPSAGQGSNGAKQMSRGNLPIQANERRKIAKLSCRAERTCER
jgi:hypothetical protein